jgi:hypothetical protein
MELSLYEGVFKFLFSEFDVIRLCIAVSKDTSSNPTAG